MLKLHWSDGNGKCAYPYWGLPAIKCCPGARYAGCDCAKEGICYAFLDELRAPDSKRNHEENLSLWLNDPLEFERQLDELYYEIEKKAKQKGETPFARPSESGDMPDKEYAKMLIRVMERHPNVFTFFFTKNYVLPDWDFINELPFWKLPNCNLMMSEWGNVKPSAELRKYYKVAKAIEIYDVETTEAEGYLHCNGKCRECDALCKDKNGDNCYFILHGAKAKFPIPDYMKEAVKVAEDTPGFHKFGGKTINGLNLNYCKVNGISTYDGRVKMLREVWEMLKRGDIKVFKNVYLVTV